MWKRWFGTADRPFVAFAATSPKWAFRLYRAQNVVWLWLGLAALLTALAYFFRPHLGLVLVTSSPVLDATRAALFAIGGVLISAGVWTVRRALEVVGHVFFSTGAALNFVATLTVPGNQIISLILLVGIALASAFRAGYIVSWITASSDHAVPGG